MGPSGVGRARGETLADSRHIFSAPSSSVGRAVSRARAQGGHWWPSASDEISRALYEAFSGALRNDGNGSVYVGYVYGYGTGALTFPKVRTVGQGHCKASHGGSSYVKPRGFHTDELLTIQQQLQYTAFQSAALMATGQCWPKKWGVGDCDKGKNSGCCGGKCRKYPNAQLPQVVGECA